MPPVEPAIAVALDDVDDEPLGGDEPPVDERDEAGAPLDEVATCDVSPAELVITLAPAGWDDAAAPADAATDPLSAMAPCVGEHPSSHGAPRHGTRSSPESANDPRCIEARDATTRLGARPARTPPTSCRETNMKRIKASLARRTLGQLAIGDERSLRHVALYADLKEVLRRAKYAFRLLPAARTDRALLLNLTFWTADGGGDILVDRRIEADVVAHAAWHHLASRSLAQKPGTRPSVDAMFLGEAIASAFDVYLVGRLLGHAPRSTFLLTQVPAMAEAADAAGLPRRDFASLLESLAEDPDRAFGDLRTLLFDTSRSLFASRSADEAFAALECLDGHRFSALLHRYELSNWVLSARAFGSRRADDRVRRVDRALRGVRAPLDWLVRHWVEPALRQT
jgi:hypothetical protein